MWKLSFNFLLLITIGNCSTYDTADTATTESSRYDRYHENRKHRSERKEVEYAKEDRRYDDDYTKEDSDEFQGGKLIGKWTNNGAAFEPKWRDGDSVPLVPFNDAKQTKVGRREQTEGSKHREYSHGVTKSFVRDASVGQNSNDGSFEDAKNVNEDNPPSYRGKKDRRYYEKDEDIPYNDKYDNSRSNAGQYSSRAEKTRTVTILTNVSRYEPSVDSSSKLPVEDEKIDSFSSSRSRYGDAFQVRPYEYELNDEEYQKPRPRKRRPPQNDEFSVIRPPTYSITWSTERYVESTPSPDRPKWTKESTETMRKKSDKPPRRNVTATLESRRVTDNAELKSLLKMQQIEGLSLSELLQRRNLTLNDLLKGKSEVIDVLRSSDNREEDATDFSIVKPKIFETKKFIYAPSSRTTERPKWKLEQQSGAKILDNGNEVYPTTEREIGVSSRENLRNEHEDVESLEHLDSAETEDGRRKSNENENLSAIVRLTNPIILPRFDSFTEKSIVVTTSTIAKQRLDVRRNDDNVVNTAKTTIFEDDEIMEFSDFTVNKKMGIMTILQPVTTTVRNIDSRFDENYEDSGSTLSIENILGTTEQNIAIMETTTGLSNNNFDDKINSIVMERTRVNDTDETRRELEYRSNVTAIAEERSDEESTMTDNSRVHSKTDRIDEFLNDEETWKNHKTFSTSGKPYEIVVSEIEPEARAEIFELFSSGSSAERLERLLEARNMSIDELIALRQRGSSKVHMAEVLRSRDQNSGSRSGKNRVNDESDDSKKIINVATTEENSTTKIDDLSDVEIETTSTEIEANSFDEDKKNIASVGTDRTSFFSSTERTNVYSVIAERTHLSSKTDEKLSKHEQLLELLTAFDSLPFSVRPDLDRNVAEERKILSETNERRVPDDFLEKTKRPDLPTSLVEVGLVEEIAKDDTIDFADSGDTNLRTNFSSTLDERKTLAKVRPSIIASGAILGVTIVVFLAIFIVCRIRQKQKYTYRNTFSRAVFQGPVMTARKLSNSSSLNTIMVNVVATSTTKRPQRHEQPAIDDEFDFKSDIENDSLDANDSWDTIPDFMK